MAFTYRQVKDLYDVLQSSGAVTKSLPEWSDEMNQATGTDLYGEGLHDNFVKRGSVGIDKLLEATGLPDLTGSFGRTVGEAVGAPEAGESVGRGLPRMALNFLPVVAAEALSGGAATPLLMGAGLAGTGALSGAETYTQTGSPAAGLLSGATAAALPYATGKIEQGILGKLGAREVSGPLANAGIKGGVADLSQGTTAIKQLFPTTFGQKAGAFLGGQAGAAGIMEASGLAQDALSGQPMHNPFSVETALNLTLGQAPFALLHLGKAAFGKAAESPTANADRLEAAISKTREAISVKQALDGMKQKSVISTIPETGPQEVDPKTLEETNLLLAKSGLLRDELKKNITPDNAADLQKATDEENKVIAKAVDTTGGIDLGTSKQEVPTDDGRIPIVGTDHYFKEKTGYHVITVADDPANAGLTYPDGTPIKAGDRIGFPAGKFDPAVNNDQSPNFLLPSKGKFTKVVDRPENSKIGEQTPELPQQKIEFDLAQHTKNLEALDGLEQSLATTSAPSYGEVLDHLTAVNAIRQQAGYPEIDLGRLIKITKDRKLANNKATVRALIDETKRMQLAEQAGKADRLVAMQKEVDFEGKLRQQAKDGDLNSRKIVEIYDALAGATGRRNDIATSGLFWQKAMELEAKGQLTPGRMASWKEGDVVTQGTGLKKEKQSEPLPDLVFKALTMEEEALRKAGAQMVMRVISNAPNSDEARILKQLVLGGDFSFSKESIAEAAFQTGLAEDRMDASHMAEEFVDPNNKLVQGWMKQLNQKTLHDDPPPFAPGETDLGQKFNDPLAYIRNEAKNAGDFLNREEPNLSEVASIKEDLLQRAQRDAVPENIVKLIEEEKWSDLASITLDDFTLGDPSRAPEPDVPYVPKEDRDAVVQKALTGDGTTLTNWLSRSTNPEMRALVSDLASNFPELLKRITSGVFDVEGTHAIRGANSQVHIKFHPSILTAETWSRENTALHELIHGLTIQELNSPTVRPELVDQLTALREKAIAALPKELRVAYDAAVKNDFIKKHANGEASYSDLAPGESSEAKRKRQILYALLNNNEFTSQTFSSPSFRAYLQGIDGKTGVWKSFVQWTRQLLRLGDKISGTALGEAMELTHQIMQNGEYILGVKDFGERYFENLGKGGTYGESQTLRGLGIIGESAGGISKDELIGSLSMGEGRFNPALTRARNKLQQTFAERGDDFQVLSSILDEHNHEPSVRGVDEFIESALSEGRDTQDALDLMPTAATRYIFEKLRDHSDVLGMVAAATKKDNQNLVNIAKPELLRGPVASLSRDLQKILKNENRQQEFAQALEGLNGVEPGEFVSRAPGELEEFSGDKPQKGQSWLANFLRPMGQLARSMPEAAEILSKGFQLAPNMRRMYGEAVKVFGMDTSSPNLDVLSHESVEASQKVFGNKKLLDVANRWIHLNNDTNRDAVTMLPETHPGVAKLVANLTPDEKALVHDIVAKQGRSTQVLNRLKLDKMQEIAAVNGAGLLTDTGLKTSQNLELSNTLLEGLLQAQDPLTQMQAQAKVQSVQQRLLPEQFLNLLKFSQGESEKIQAWKKYFEANPFWATAARTEQYLVRYTKGGKAKLGQASSLKEARDLIEKAGGREVEIKDQWKGREDEPFAFPNFPPETAARMKQIEENQIQMMRESGVLATDADVSEARRTSAVMQIIREASAQTSLPGVTPPARLLSQGAEDLPWLWNHISNAQRESAYWSRQLLRAQARTYLKDPELSGNEQLRSQLATHFENLLHPDPIAAQKMTRLASTWFLGFNLASTIINAAQPFVTHVGELTSLTGKPIDSYRRVLRALDELGGRFIGKKEWSTPEHEKFMNDAVRDSEVGIGMYDEQAEAEESTATRFKQAMMKNKVQDLGQRLSSAAGSYSTAAMWVFQHGERLNARAALLASFDLYREQGLGYEEAKQKAYEFNRAVNYSGGRAQRPIGAFSGRGAFPRTVAMLGTSLQSYVLGTTFQLARYLQKGGFRPQGLKPHEVYAARKAALQMLGTQFAAAGLLGLPFASGAIALLNQLFPDLELPKKIREGVGSFLSSDKENGSTLTDIAMTGVPSMLGWDMQSRLSMGNTLPGVSEVNGFQPENLMGPAGNIIKNFVGGVQGWSRGDAGSSTRFLPPAIAKLTQLASAALTDGGEIRDYRGRPLDAPTPGEHVGQLLGFQPKRLSDQNAAGRIAEQADRVQGQREGQFRQDLAKEALKGNFGTIRSSIQQRLRDDKTYNVQDAVRGVAQAAEDLTFPRDLRREGSKNDSRSQLLSSYSNLNSGSPSEEARYAFRQGIEGRLGLQPSRSGVGLVLARTMDQLKLAQPQATRVELRAAATALLRRTQPQLLLEPVE